MEVDEIGATCSSHCILRRRRFLLKCRWAFGSVPLFNTTGGVVRVRKSTCRNKALKSVETKTASSPPESIRPHNSLCNCCCSVLFPISVHKCLDTHFSQSKPLSQIQNLTVRLIFKFLCFFEGALLLNVNKMVKRVLLIMGVQQLKTSSASCVQIWSFGFVRLFGLRDKRQNC